MPRSETNRLLCAEHNFYIMQLCKLTEQKSCSMRVCLPCSMRSITCTHTHTYKTVTHRICCVCVCALVLRFFRSLIRSCTGIFRTRAMENQRTEKKTTQQFNKWNIWLKIHSNQKTENWIINSMTAWAECNAESELKAHLCCALSQFGLFQHEYWKLS